MKKKTQPRPIDDIDTEFTQICVRIGSLQSQLWMLERRVAELNDEANEARARLKAMPTADEGK